MQIALLIASSVICAVSASQTCSVSSTYYNSNTGNYVTSWSTIKCGSYCCGTSSKQYCCSDCSLSYNYSGLCPWQIMLIVFGCIIFVSLVIGLPVRFCVVARKSVQPARTATAMTTYSITNPQRPVAPTYASTSFAPSGAYAPPAPPQYSQFATGADTAYVPPPAYSPPDTSQTAENVLNPQDGNQKQTDQKAL